MPHQWLRPEPPRVTRHVVAIGGVLLALLTALLDFSELNLNEAGLLVGFVAIACLFERQPRLAWTGYVLLFVIVEQFSQATMAPVTLVAPIVVGLITFRSNLSEALLGMAALWYFGLADPIGERFLPSDAVPAAIWAAMLLAGMAVGFYFRLARARYVRREAQWRDEAEQQRRELAHTLHDSVATSLSAVVMRSQVLNLRKDIDAEMAEDLQLIAEKSRDAMADVRNMLRLMSPEAQSRPRAVAPSAEDQIAEMKQTLENMQFSVRLRQSDVPYLNADGLAALRQVLRELATNISKYAVPRSLVEISADRSRVVVRNLIGGGVMPELSSGLGLPAVEQLAKSAGIRYSSRVVGEHWCTELEVDADK